MCQICRKFPEVQLTPDRAREAMKEIEMALQHGTKQEHFEGLLDRILGTGLPPRDATAEAVYEAEHREDV